MLIQDGENEYQIWQRLDMNCKCVKAVPKDNVAKDCPNKGVTQVWVWCLSC